MTELEWLILSIAAIIATEILTLFIMRKGMMYFAFKKFLSDLTLAIEDDEITPAELSLLLADSKDVIQALTITLKEAIKSKKIKNAIDLAKKELDE